jgi:hypothetical protein
VLGVACRERPTHMVSRMLWVTNDGQALTPRCVALVPDGEQGNSGVVEVGQVALTKLREGLVGSPLQSVIEVVSRSRGERSRHARVGGVSQDVNMDLTMSMPVLTVQAATVRGSPHVAKVVQHVPEQGWEAKMVQPIATKPSIGSEGAVGVVVHLPKTKEKWINISSIEQR